MKTKPPVTSTPSATRHPARTPGRVFAVIFVFMLCALGAAKLLAARDVRQQLEFDPNRQAIRPGLPKPVQTPYSLGFQSPVTNTGDRVTECLALLQALAVARLQWQPTGRVPADVRGLLEPLAAGKLLPPGIAWQNGTLRSDRSDLMVRYRPLPYGVEIISRPRDVFGGPVLLLRSPALAPGKPASQAGQPGQPGQTGQTGSDSPPVDFFVWLRRDQPNLPPPFAANAGVGLAGWSEQPLTVTPLPENEVATLRLYLARQTPGKQVN